MHTTTRDLMDRRRWTLAPLIVGATAPLIAAACMRPGWVWAVLEIAACGLAGAVLVSSLAIPMIVDYGRREGIVR